MILGATKRLARRCWGRRWFRRITYLLISGAAVTGTGLWTVRQPFFNRWLIEKLDERIREETGLGFQAESLDFQVFQGRIVLRKFSLGEDLLRADRLEVQVDFSSFLGRNWHIWNIELENPASVLDAQRLSRIRLKSRPNQGASPQVQLDRLTVLGGQLTIQEPAWELPRAEFTYRVYGQGLGPNRLAVDLRIPKMEFDRGSGTVDGSLIAKANLSDLAVELKEGELRLGGNHLLAQGNYAFDARMLTAKLKGRVDLAEALKLLDPKAAPGYEGSAEFEAGVQGLLKDPAWNLAVHGKGLSAPTAGLRPGDLDIAAHGNLRDAVLQKLDWHSSQGRLRASGRWAKGSGSRLEFHGERFGLAPLASYVKVGFLDQLSLDLDGEADLPGDPWSLPRLDAVKLRAQGRFLQDSGTVGRLAVELDHGQLTLPELELDLPELTLNGSASLRLGKQSLQSLSAKGRIETDAARVADGLHAWEIGEGTTESGAVVRMDMAGRAVAEAEVFWDGTAGVRLKGQVEVEAPRWHGATMDRLRADVAIENEELRVENLQGEKAEGSASGSLWLTWRTLPQGQDEMDMYFQAFKLPIEEGLKAADVNDIPITGLGSGWARVHGTYSQLWVEAGATAEGASVYGMRIPFSSGEMSYDITGDRLLAKNVRIAETAEQLGAPDEEPSGSLALKGSMDMDLKRETWQVAAKGSLDTKSLGLPGPEIQALVEARFEGPWVVDYGPLPLPMGTFSFSSGRMFLDQQSFDGLEGRLETRPGTLRLELNATGKARPLVRLEAQPQGQGLTGSMSVHIAPDSVDTPHLAARLTDDLLKDGALDLEARGSWDPAGLRWEGTLANVVGHFEGFDLVQQGAASVKGDDTGAALDIKLTGRGTGQGMPPSAIFRISGRVPFTEPEPLDLRVEGEAELANLKNILDHVLEVDEYSLLADLKPEGSARFDLKLGGPYSLPTLDGLLSLKAGRLEIRTYPQSVEDLSFNLHFQGRDLILLESDPLRGRVAQGAFRAWGVATWDIGELSKYELQTRLEDFQLRDLPEGFELYGTLDAVLLGTKEEGGILSGALQARRMLYQADINLRDLILASAMGSSSSPLGVDPNDPMTKIDLDLDLVLNRPWEFDSNLLKLQGRPTGPFKVVGTLAEPGLSGKMDILPGGRLTNLLPAGDVVLERGRLEWTNPRVWFPTVDLQGRVDVPPYLVNLEIRGNMDGLEMKQSSTPSLRQDEITAILIDPSLAPDIGTLSGPATATAINSGLANTGSGLVTTLALANFQETLRRAFKLDRVSVAWRTGGGGASPETSVTVGKSINLFGHRTPVVLTHQKSGTTATTSGQVEWRFGNFVLQLGVSQSGVNGAAPSGEIRHTWSPGW